LIGGKDTRKFEFDHAFWSFDGFKEEADGYKSPAVSKYIDQKEVWKLLGETMLDKAWKGLNTTIFAYG